jgi:hypothetical protein
VRETKAYGWASGVRRHLLRRQRLLLVPPRRSLGGRAWVHDWRLGPNVGARNRCRPWVDRSGSR